MTWIAPELVLYGCGLTVRMRNPLLSATNAVHLIKGSSTKAATCKLSHVHMLANEFLSPSRIIPNPERSALVEHLIDLLQLKLRN